MDWLWRHSKTVKLAADWLTWLAAFPIALWLRLDLPPNVWTTELFVLALVAAPSIWFCITAFGLQRQSWGHASLNDAIGLGLAIATGTIVTLALSILVNGLLPVHIPRSVPIIAGVIALAVMGGYRLGVRAFVEQRQKGSARILLAGTGDAAILFARQAEGQVKGFIDDDPTRNGLSYLGRPVLGTSHDIENLLQDIDEVVIAWPPHRLASKRVEDACHARDVRVRYLADPSELLYGRLQRADATGEDLQPLLHREVTKLDVDSIRHILEDEVVLVTGAGGSIGSELVRQIIDYRPAKLCLLSHDENSIFELQAQFPAASIELIVANVQDHSRIDQVFRLHRPRVVFHAAAHKHVPLMEQHPAEAVANNVGGTRNLLEASLRHGVHRFVNISTDKAVHPTNIMGATKNVAEMLVRDAAKRAPDGHFVSVRFGNVLGSRGSVVPTWEKQIRRGGPLTLTDDRMTRYFMLIPEAVQLVLQAGQFGGRGTTYVLKMGDPVRIRDMAEQLIRLHGFVPGKDIRIETTGLRPGEKLYEELLLDASRIAHSPHDKILIEGDLPVPDDFQARVGELLRLAQDGDAAGVRLMLQDMVPGAKLGAAHAPPTSH